MAENLLKLHVKRKHALTGIHQRIIIILFDLKNIFLKQKYMAFISFQGKSLSYKPLSFIFFYYIM